jgi:hypothetical protein
MTPDILHKHLLHAIEKQIPEGKSIVNILMNILSIRKEAVYQRLREGVTLQETIIIAKN